MSEEGIRFVTLDEILSAWNLQQYYDSFCAEEIDVDELSQLILPEWSGILEKIIPVAGHRMRFSKKVLELFADNNLRSSDQNQSNSSFINKNSFDSELEITTESKFAAKDIINPKTIDNVINNLIVESDNSILKPEDVSSDVQTPPLPSTINDLPRKRPADSEDNHHKAKCSKVLQPLELENTTKWNLRKALSNSGSGRCLLSLATQSKSIKDERDQNKLAEIVIEEELRNSDKIEANTFLLIVEAIKELFPDEQAEVYYIPYRKEGDYKCLAKGKLVNKYYSLRKQFKTVGLIGVPEKNDSDCDIENDQELLSIEEKLNFLKDNTEPFEIILEYWKDTSKFRIRKLQTFSIFSKKKTKTSKLSNSISSVSKEPDEDFVSSIASYISNYPALREKEGYSLLEADFDILYPDHKLKVYSNWDNFSMQVTSALQSEKIKSIILKDNLSLLEDEKTDKDTRILIILLSLCYLDSVVTITRLKKDDIFKTWRPPHVELQEGVISLIESSGKLDTFITARYAKFSQWKLTVQPFCVVCGPALDKIDSCYVVLDRKTKYLMKSPLRALDICFKIIHATHAEYSVESYRLWMLIQKKLYGLDTKFDNQKNDAQLPKLLKKFQ